MYTVNKGPSKIVAKTRRGKFHWRYIQMCKKYNKPKMRRAPSCEKCCCYVTTRRRCRQKQRCSRSQYSQNTERALSPAIAFAHFSLVLSAFALIVLFAGKPKFTFKQ